MNSNKMLIMRKLYNVFSLVALFVCAYAPLMGQESSPVVSTKKHKVVFQLTSDDTLVHKALLKQIENFTTAAPNARIEVVCHNNGISFLKKDGNRYADKIRHWSAKGVDFVACENTMKQRKIKREDLVESCRTVPAGILEIVQKQEKKWSYLKAGF